MPALRRCAWGFFVSYTRARQGLTFAGIINWTSSDHARNPNMKQFLTIVALFAALCVNAQTLTISGGSAEVSGAAKNQLYPLSSLFFNYNTSTDKFEAYQAETRSLVYEANISTVTISGLSTAAAKIAHLENTHLKCNSGVYNVLVPKDGIAIRYRSSNKFTELYSAISEGKKALFGGHMDSIKTASTDSTTALRLTALRKIVRGATPYLIGNNSNAATIAAGAAAGTSPTVAITGNGLSGEVDIDTGSSTTTTGVIATVTLPVAYPNGCRVVITPSTSFSATMVARVFVNTTASGFTLNAAGTAVTASTPDLKFFYTVTGY